MYLQYKVYLSIIRWNPFTPDTIGTTVSVLILGVSLFQGLNFVSICGKTKCLDLRGVRTEGFHCIKKFNFAINDYAIKL